MDVANAVTVNPNADTHRRIYHRRHDVDKTKTWCKQLTIDADTVTSHLKVQSVLLCRRCFPR